MSISNNVSLNDASVKPLIETMGNQTKQNVFADKSGRWKHIARTHGNSQIIVPNKVVVGSGSENKAPKKTTNASGTKKTKPKSMPLQWTEAAMKDTQKPWFAFSEDKNTREVMYRWNGTYLEHTGSGDTLNVATKWLRHQAPDKADVSLAEKCLDFAASIMRTDRPMPKMDEKRNLIPCGDVYLEIAANGDITALRPDASYGLSYCLSLNAGVLPGDSYIPKDLLDTSLFKQWIEKALPDASVRELVQEQCGMTLLPTNFSIATWWFGKAGCGKSMLSEICQSMQRHASSTSLEKIGERFGLENLLGSSLICVDEVDSNEKWNEGLWKSLVSGNSVFVDRKNEKALASYKFKAKWIITSNGKPFIRDKSDGVWRRLCAVEWTVDVPEEDRKNDFHMTLMAEEGQQILDWMLQGAQRLVKRGRFMSESERPRLVQNIKEDCRQECDSVRAWVKEWGVYVTKQSDKFKSRTDIYQTYVDWCAASHQKALDNRVFWKGLRGMLVVQDSNRRVSGKQVYFSNIVWKGPSYDAQPIVTPDIMSEEQYAGVKVR